MATKPRHKKTETQLWVYDNAKRLKLTEDDLARATGVEPGTARSWFSRGKPNADAIPVLEKLFGRPAPADDQPETGSVSELAASIRTLAQSIAEERAERLEWERSFVEAVRELAQAIAQRDDPEPVPLANGQGVGR